MTRHAGAETLAGFRQGELSLRRSARIRAHLAGCARCSDLNEDLAGVTTLLARVPPPPIPEHLTARIRGALAAEAARRATLTADSAPGVRAETVSPAGTAVRGGATGTPGPERRERPGHGGRLPRLPRISPVALRVAATAAAIVIIAGSYEIVQHAGVSSTGAPSAASKAPQSQTASGSASSGISAGARALGPVLPYRHAGGEDSFTPIATDTDFTPGNLKREVSTELTRDSPARVRTSAPSSVAPNAARSQAAVPARPSRAFGIPIAALAGCVSRVAAGELVLLVDVARYQGVPATVIVTGVSAVRPGQIWVVGMSCSGSRSDVLTHMTLANGG